MQCKNLCLTVKHGGSDVSVWGYLSGWCSKFGIYINCNMNQHIYLNIIKNNIHSNALKLNLGKSFIFQHDNDPKHTARKIKESLIYNVPQFHTPPHHRT